MAQVNIRIDDDLKARGEELFHSLGLTLSSAICVFINQSIKENGLPFTPTNNVDPFYSESNLRVLRQAIREANEGRLTAHELIEN